MITDELDTVMEWYTISVDTHRSMKYLINKNPDAVPLKSLLVSRELSEANELLDTAILELNDQTIISLVSVFEQTLIHCLREIIKNQMNSEVKDEVYFKLKEYTIKQAEHGRFNDMIDLFSRSSDKSLAGLVKQIYKYRNWVAHGKRPEKVPAKTDPVSAYRNLSEFLNQLQISGLSNVLKNDQ